MNRELISIIIPVCNVEPYLCDCAASVCKQTYKDIEILLIDDGSTDGSGALCDEYAQKDNRIRVVHQKNQGLSSARNKGIDIAKGRYITFIDSDDYVAPNIIENLYRAIKTTGNMMSLCDFVCVKERDEYEKMIALYKKEDCSIEQIDNKMAIKEVYNKKIHCMDFVAVAKLYDIALFKNHSISFPIGKLHEDAFTTYKLFYLSGNISYVESPLYFYRMRQGTITKSGFSERRLDKIEATRGECEFFLDKNEHEMLRYAFLDHLHEMKIILREIETASDSKKEYIFNICSAMNNDLSKYGKVIKIPVQKKWYYKFMSAYPELAKLKLFRG